MTLESVLSTGTVCQPGSTAAACPLCGQWGYGPSWLGSTFFHGREFPYVRCCGCGSLYCRPMPDHETLSRMYGPDYETSFAAVAEIQDPKEPERALSWLRRLGGGGTFLDYGCGSGSLLVKAAGLGWRAVGVEFDAEVAARVARNTGLCVVSDPARLRTGTEPPADVLHLGDVIEHLTDLERQTPEILTLLKPGGVLLAQGPLEANANLFTFFLRAFRAARRRRVEMAPYHVLLATADGQRRFFNRFGLQELEYKLSEVSWPAPQRLGRASLGSPRAVGLFLLRKGSQAVSALRPSRWGNRYFYAGRRHGE